MKEYDAHAQAGFESRPHILGILDSIGVLLATPYAPTLSSLDPRIFVLDLSQYNNVAMAAVKAFLDPRVQALVIRIGGSASVRDTKFEMFWRLAKEFKLLRSIYTYNWPGWTVDQHIRNFMESVEEMADGDLGEGPIWVDAECHANKTKREVSNHTNSYRLALVNETHKIVGVYTGPWFIDGYMEIQDWFEVVLFWLAVWLANQPKEHPGPVTYHAIPYENILMHQTGSNCDATLFNGIGRVDTDRWQSTEEKFYELFGGEPPAPPPPGDLEEQVKRNTMDIAEIYERINIIDEFLRSYNER